MKYYTAGSAGCLNESILRDGSGCIEVWHRNRDVCRN